MALTEQLDHRDQQVLTVQLEQQALQVQLDQQVLTE